jgi:hypothetical protein
MFDLGPRLQAHTTILSSCISACAQGTMPVGQAEHLSTAHPEALSVSCVGCYLQQPPAPLLPSVCLPPSNLGLESKVLTLGAAFHARRYEVYLRYLFDPLLSQGMKVESFCSREWALPCVLEFAWHLWKKFLTQRTLCPTFHVIADSAQAVLTSRAKESEFD